METCRANTGRAGRIKPSGAGPRAGRRELEQRLQGLKHGGILIGELVFLSTSRQLVFAVTVTDAAAVSGINGSSSSVNMNPF